MIQKIQAFVYRYNNAIPELLIFEHDITKINELIRGTVEQGEDLETAVLREIEEESGLTEVQIIQKLDDLVFDIKGGPTRSGSFEKQHHHAFLVELKGFAPNKWTHLASGSIEENGLKLHYYWKQIDFDLESILFSDFVPFIPKLRSFFGSVEE